MVLSFLYKCVRVFCEYFKELEEESIRDNFVIVYELLDELMDFGFPQSTDSKILQEYITQEGHKLEEVRPPPALTQTVSWRSDGLKYRKNEVFLDVIESVNLLVLFVFVSFCLHHVRVEYASILFNVLPTVLG
jgi:AP-1 complex subunit mu